MAGGEAARLYVSVGADVNGAIRGLRATDAQFKKTASSAKAMDAQMRRSSSTAKGASVAYAGLGSSAREVERGANRAAPAVQKTTAATGRLRTMAGSASKGLGGVVTGLTGMTPKAAGAAGAVVSVGYAFGKSVRLAADFDSGMRNVNSIAGLSEASFQKLKAQVLDLAGPTAQTPQTLADGMYQLVSSGFRANDAVKVLKASSIAASAGLTDAATATTAVAGVLNAYHLSAAKAGQVSDDLFQTVNLGVISFEQLAQGIGPVLPFAYKLGISLKQVGAMTATLTKAGIPAAESFTYMKGAMAQMVKPSEALSNQFKKLGVSSGAELVRKTGSFQAALEALYRSVGGDQQKFADLFPDIRGMTAAFAATGKGAKSAAGDLRDFNNTAGQTKRVFAEQQKGQAFGFKQLRAEIQQTAVVYGSKLSPAVSTGMRGIGTALKAVRSDVGQFIIEQTAKGGIAHAIFGPVGAGTAAVSGVRRALGSLKGKGAGLGKLETNYRIKVDNKDAISKTANTKRGLDSIPGVTTARIRVISPDDPVITRTKTALTRLGRPVRIKTEITRAGNANTVVSAIKPKPIKVTADTSAAQGKAKAFVETVNGLKPKKTRIDANAKPAISAANQTIQALASIPSSKTVTINIRTNGKIPGRAGGGRVSTALTEVNERGPESITSPGGNTAMLGDGRRQVMALPVGWHVNTAAQTKSLFGNIPGLAKGGSVPKRKKGESRSEFQSRYNEWVRHKQTIADARSDRAIAKIPLTTDASGNVVEDTLAIDKKNIARAERHIQEAKKLKGRERSEALAQAKAEKAQAEKQYNLDAAALKATTDNTAAIQAQTDAMKSLADSISESNRIATATHSTNTAEVNRAVLDWISGNLGGRAASSLRTLGPAATY